MSDQQPSTGSNDKIENLKPSWIVRCVAEAKRYFYEYQSKKKNESPQDRFSRRTANATLWIAILTFVTIIVGIFQFIVFRGQLTAMKEQLAEMKSTGRQTDDLISANKNLVEVAHGQLEVMHGQLNQMRSALAEQKLTDLLLTRGILTFDPNSWEMNGAKEGNGVNAISTTGMQAISFILKNTGKNPVYIMQSSYEYVISDKLPPVDVDQNTGELRFIGTSPIRISDIPSLFGEESSVRLVIPNLPAISEAGKIAITEGKEHAYLRIVIFYLDQFNWRYEYRITAQYGRKIGPGGALIFGFIFPEGNITDHIVLSADTVSSAWLKANNDLNLRWRPYNYIVARCGKGDPLNADCPFPQDHK